jgi:ABC-type multidrug transport system fused ATPase/permease subunit
LSGLQDIRILHAGKKVDLLFNKHNKELFTNDVNCKREMLNAQFFIDFMNLVVQLCIYLFTIYLSSKNSITIGLITVILAFYTTLKGKINALSSSFFDAQERISYIQKINEFLHKETEDEGDNKNILQVRKGNISFEHVIYSYDSKKEVLRVVDLEILSGEKFALVGESGSGKTTIAYLLNRFYIPNGGTIKIDSVELDTCSLKSIRNQVGMVAQDVLLFEGTIRENLLLGDIHASEEKMQQACQKAGIWDFICTLDSGLDTMVGKGGRSLSGGQKQRIAIARIYLKNPPIIIFDEATSALDSETEGLILSEWEQALENRTAVVIAHRYSSVLKCDRCGLLKDGVITEIGKPLDLAKTSIQFKTLFAL